MKAPVVGGEVDRAASDAPPIFEVGSNNRLLAFRLAERVGLQRVIARKHFMPDRR